VEVGIGARVLAVAKEFNQGKLTSTENPLDMAINGEGFLQAERRWLVCLFS
jgi:flagellar hook protein FlgE